MLCVCMLHVRVFFGKGMGVCDGNTKPNDFILFYLFFFGWLPRVGEQVCGYVMCMYVTCLCVF
jgi:hypothetical protein